jgi:hypothetical protein
LYWISGCFFFMISNTRYEEKLTDLYPISKDVSINPLTGIYKTTYHYYYTCLARTGAILLVFDNECNTIMRVSCKS